MVLALCFSLYLFIYSENNSKDNFYKLTNLRSFPVLGPNWRDQYFPIFLEDAERPFKI